jgi:hypothetical protein
MTRSLQPIMRFQAGSQSIGGSVSAVYVPAIVTCLPAIGTTFASSPILCTLPSSATYRGRAALDAFGHVAFHAGDRGAFPIDDRSLKLRSHCDGR